MTSMLTRYKKGDVREDGWVFRGYNKGREDWLSPDAMLRNRIHGAYYTTQRRARDKSVPFSITKDYLLSIFPRDSKCPVLGVTMDWGDKEGRETSPSLDRIIPELGYVEGNLIWVSQKANGIKQNATPDEIIAVGRFYADMLHKVRH